MMGFFQCKIHIFIATARTHPTFYIDLRTVVLTFQYIYNLYSTNSFHFFHLYDILSFERPHAQHVDLLLCQESPVASTDVLFRQPGKQHAVELHHTVT